MDNVDFFQAFHVCIFAGVLYVSWHGNVECSGGVVPIERYSAMHIARPIFDKIVCLVYASYEMVRMFFSNVFDPKIVHHCEQNWAEHVFPQSRGVGIFIVSVWQEPFSEELVGKNASLGEAPDSTLHFDVYKPISCVRV
jgi:hypothetical protein